jgi:hypothetical protein
MTFRVNSSEIRAYADALNESYADVAAAKNYAALHGGFSFHEAGVIGALAGRHAGLMDQLEQLHNQLLTVLWRSRETLIEVAGRYDDTDVSSAARIDAGYPPVPRPASTRD